MALGLRRLASDRRGTAAIEFAFIAPILMLFYFAVVEISLLLQADRKVTTVASAIGDLVAQTDETDAAEIEAIFNVADAIMQPLDDGPMELRVTSVEMEDDGDVKVTWSRARNTTTYGCGAALTVPDGVLTPGQTVIVAEVAYTYEPPIGRVLTGDVELKDTFYLRPRKTIEVDFDPEQC